MHASLLNEDLIQPGKLEMGISHRTGGRTRHFDWGRQETTPGWLATRKLSRNGVRRHYKNSFPTTGLVDRLAVSQPKVRALNRKNNFRIGREPPIPVVSALT
jgi:hypothetical protein